jgi:hypothetical protein
MKWLLTVAVIGGIFARWGMVTMDDTALRDDVLFSEVFTSQRPEVDAAVMVPFLEKAMRERRCELVPDTLQIDVSDARDGVLKIEGAGLAIQGKGPTRVQDIQIRFTCRRPGVFFVKTSAVYALSTQAPGNGRANHWPRADAAQ